jgi:hypothetical protein
VDVVGAAETEAPAERVAEAASLEQRRRHGQSDEGEPGEAGEDERADEQRERDEHDDAEHEGGEGGAPAGARRRGERAATEVGERQQRRGPEEHERLHRQAAAERRLVQDRQWQPEREAAPEATLIEADRLGHELPHRPPLGRERRRRLLSPPPGARHVRTVRRYRPAMRRAALLHATVCYLLLLAPGVGHAAPRPACLDALAWERPQAPPAWLPAWLPTARPRLLLPRGGRTILPRFRVVAFYGAPQAEALGAAGIGTPLEAAQRLLRQARPYRRGGRPVLPAVELIADLVKPFPTSDGTYRIRQTPATVCRFLAAARAVRGLLVLDLQPGLADFVREAEAFRPYLEEPDVSLALDPEWVLAPGTVPGEFIGHTEAATINRVSAYLARLVARNRLPDKLLIVHQFTPEMVTSRELLRRRPGVELTLNVDGVGLPPDKLAAYRLLAAAGDPWFHGFKLFYEEDRTVMTPAEVLALRPRPDVVIYE